MTVSTAPASLLTRLGSMPGLDPAWSRTVSATDLDGVERRWHVLDNGAQPTVGTMVCVHGNPTWSYLWRRFVAEAAPGWRVVAVDQLGMGWSDRLEAPRSLPQRVADLGTVVEALGVTGPVVLAAHDWGGPVSLGWALAHRDQLAGVILTNTGVALLDGEQPPALIRLARTPVLRDLVCVTTPTFVRSTTALSRPPLPLEVRDSLAAPYATPARRQSIGDFVADIPVEHDHVSRATLADIAAGIHTLEVPVLMLWGPRDPVFSLRFLGDLVERLPHADVHRYPYASHLVTEDAPQTAEHAWRWVAEQPFSRVAPSGSAPSDGAADRPSPSTAEAPVEPPTPTPTHTRPPWAALSDRAQDQSTAVVELGGEAQRRVSFAELEQTVRDLAAGLHEAGVRAGDRVALLVPPGIDLTAALYACWRIGAVIVVADAGLGVSAMGRALRGAGPSWIIGIPKALAAAAVLRIPGRRIVVGTFPRDGLRPLRVEYSLERLIALGRGRDLPSPPGPEAESAVLFTSGATGPSKGVVYRLGQLAAQLELLDLLFDLRPDDRMVAAFAPFALYGPALGIGAAVPDMDVTAPGTLTAQALADAVLAVGATVVLASPAALRNVLATQQDLDPAQRAALGRVRRLMSFGAPVPARLLRAVQTLLPAAELHTPYGMTEVLPVADISLPEIEAAGSGNGICVGWPLPGVTLAVSPMTDDGSADGPLTQQPGVTGEVLVAASHVKDRYDRLWVTEQESSRTAGWHRSGDVGHLDPEGRLWVEGRLVHVVTTADGVVTPVGVEQRVEELDAVQAAAVVGVGPVGTQQVVVVVVPSVSGSTVGGSGVSRVRALSGRTRAAARGQADASLSAAVRAVAGVPVAAVLTLDALPVDIRHASKVDRARVGRWAANVLTGARVGKL
ncbi:MAG TPA: alpha/beta fold hydrolase [Propionibacteriaceae bacterium]